MRLMYSENLPADAKARYEAYLTENAGTILPWLVASGERERCIFMLTSHLAETKDAGAALPYAVERHDAELVGMLMEYGREAQKSEEDFFDLEDL